MRAVPISQTDYPAVRRVMGHDRHHLNDEDVESLLEGLFPDSDPTDVESFMGALQRFGNEVAPIAQRALPGAVQGAVTGAGVGGPYGALAGAALGATGALTSSPRPAAPRSITPQPTPPQPTVSQPQMPAQPPVALLTTPVAPVSPQAAAAALLEILSNKATLEGLMAVLMQAAGRETVKVGAQQVPPAAFANAIAEFAGIAATSESLAESRSDYLYGDSGWPRGDLANPMERAAILLSDLREAANDESISAYERVAHGWWTDD